MLISLAGGRGEQGLRIQNTEMPLGRISSIIAPPGEHSPPADPVLHRGFKSFLQGKNEVCCKTILGLHIMEMESYRFLYTIRKSHADEHYIVFLVPRAAKLSFTTPTQSLTPLILEEILIKLRAKWVYNMIASLFEKMVNIPSRLWRK